MNAVSARKVVAILILAAGIGISIWVLGMFKGERAALKLLGTALMTLPFVVLALIARFMASSWFSLVLVLIAAAGTAWFSTYVYPSSRGDAQGAVMFIFMPVILCKYAGVVALLVLLTELMVRSRARWAQASHEPDPDAAAKQVSFARWVFAGSAVLFVAVAGASVTQIAHKMLRHHEVNAARNLPSQDERLRVLEKALTANDAEILGILARQELPGDDLRRIYEASRQSRHDGSTALHSLASNPRTPPDLLTALANGSTASRVARNPSAPAALLERLAAHEDKSVRQHVAVNPSASLELLTKLKQDADDMVRRAASQTLNKAKNKGKAGKKKAGEKKPL